MPDSETPEKPDFEDKAKIKFAPTTRIGYLEMFVDEVVDAICDAIGIPGAMVTDLSSISDFPVGEEDLKKISEQLGVPVTMDDYIVDVAQRLKDKL